MGYFHGVTKSLKRLSIHTDCFARQRGTQQIFASEKLCLNLRVFNEEFIAIRLFNRRFLRVAQTVKHLCLQCGRPGFDPWVRKFSWRRAQQLTPVSLPGESPRTEEPGGLQSIGSHSVGHN